MSTQSCLQILRRESEARNPGNLLESDFPAVVYFRIRVIKRPQGLCEPSFCRKQNRLSRKKFIKL